MRKLIVDDIQRFSTMVEAAGVREIIADGLKRGAAEAANKRELLLKLKRELDEAKDAPQRDDVMRRLMTAQKDDMGFYRVGIDVAMQVLTVAAKKGVMDCVYKFLSPIFELSPEELAELPLEEFAPMLKQLAAENNLADFFDLPGLTQAK